MRIEKEESYDLNYKYSNGLFLEYLNSGFLYKILKSADDIVYIA